MMADAVGQGAARPVRYDTKFFNDPIHGQIEINPVCCRIIDTPQFQRLRHIKQLDTCYLVYPGASHNRFEHSLGVCYLAGKLLKTIQERQPNLKINKKDILCVEIAGLCHDLGQGPFSHVFEKRFMPNLKKSFTHENMARKMFEHMLKTKNRDKDLKTEIKEIADYWTKLNSDGNIMEIAERTDIAFIDRDFDFICEMIDDSKDLSIINDNDWPYIGRGTDKSFMYEIIANKRNGIDVDKWDYLARDSYMLGMKVNVDYNRCFSSARVIKCNGANDTNGSDLPLRNQICYRETGAQDLYDMFYTRMTLHRRAYQHKTHKVIGMMICDALEAAEQHFLLKEKRISETVDDMETYTYLTDDVINLIAHEKDTNLKEAQDILHDITHRRLYKLVTEQRCGGVNITENDVKEGIANNLQGTHMEERFFCCDIVKFNYGMNCKNPMEKVRFYKKEAPDKPLIINKNQVSFILPETFQESVIRIYCKKYSDEQRDTAEKIKEAFYKWWEGSPFSVQGEQTKAEKSTQTDQSVPENPDNAVSTEEQREVPLPEPAPNVSFQEQPPYNLQNIAQRSLNEGQPRQ